LELFLKQAQRQGITQMGIVEHLYLFPEARHLLHVPTEGRTRDMVDYVNLVELARSEGLDLRLGLEVDYVPGKEDETAAVLDGLPLDFVIGSVHWLGDWAFDLSREGWIGRDVAAVFREYYDTLAQAAESGLFDILGHPGNIAYFGHRPEPELMDELEDAFLKRISHLPMCLEINTGGYLRPAQELFPRWEMVKRIRHYGFDIVVSSDAHRPADVGHAIGETRTRLKESGFSTVQTFAKRQKQAAYL